MTSAARLTLREAMIHAGERGRAAVEAKSPERYYWAAVWWRLHARETHPSMRPECIGFARSQIALFNDIIRRPDHYARKPADKTDWQWSELSAIGERTDS